MMKENSLLERPFYEHLYNGLLYIILFFLIWGESSFYSVNALSGTNRLIVCGIIIFLSLLLIKTINKLRFVLVCFIIGWVLLMDCVLSPNALKQTLIIIIEMLTGIFVASLIDKRDFVRKFTNIILFFAIYSLVTFALSYLIPDFIYSFPIIISRNGHSYYNLFFSVVTDNDHVIRNYGLFWEPGAFSVFLCIALYLELFAKEKIRFFRVFVLSLTILSTKSTLGILAFVLLYLIFFVYAPSKKVRWLSLLVVVTLGAVILLVFSKSVFGEVFDKLFKKDNFGNTNSSLQIRYDAVVYILKEFFKSFTVGIGIEKFMKVQEEYCSNMATATMVNWLAIYGLIWGAAMIFGYIKFFIARKSKLIKTLLVIVFTCFLISTENFLMNPFIYTLVFYGLTGRGIDETSFSGH